MRENHIVWNSLLTRRTTETLIDLLIIIIPGHVSSVKLAHHIWCFNNSKRTEKTRKTRPSSGFFLFCRKREEKFSYTLPTKLSGADKTQFALEFASKTAQRIIRVDDLQILGSFESSKSQLGHC